MKWRGHTPTQQARLSQAGLASQHSWHHRGGAHRGSQREHEGGQGVHANAHALSHTCTLSHTHDEHGRTDQLRWRARTMTTKSTTVDAWGHDRVGQIAGREGGVSASHVRLTRNHGERTRRASMRRRRVAWTRPPPGRITCETRHATGGVVDRKRTRRNGSRSGGTWQRSKVRLQSRC